MITASSLMRLMECPGSTLLPRAENASEWADAGQDEHEDLAGDLAAGTLPDWIAAVMPTDARSEVAVAFDVATGIGRLVGENLARAYGSMAPFEICGSADVIGTDGDAVVVLDYKTGFRDVESAATNPQLALYALAAARALGKHRAIVRIIYTKMERIDSAELDALDLAAFAERLVALHRRVAQATAMKLSGEPVSTREGSWCRYCPSKSHCPSKTALLVQIAEKGLAVIGDAAMTPERAAAAYQQIEKVEQLVKDARKRLEAYVDEQGPIDLGGGKMYGRYHRKGNEKLDGDLAVQAIREVVGEQAKEFEAIAIERKTVATKAAIKRAAQQLVSIGAPKVEKAVLARLKELGGIKSEPTIPLGEFVRAKNDPATLPEIDADNLNRLLSEAG